MSQTQQMVRLVTVSLECGVVDGVTLPRHKLDANKQEPPLELMPSYYHHERCGCTCGDIIYRQATDTVQTALDESAAESFFEPAMFDWMPPGCR